MSALRVSIDRDRCEGIGNCGFYAPNTFEVGDDAKVTLLSGDDSDSDVRTAVDSCPLQALAIESSD